MPLVHNIRDRQVWLEQLDESPDWVLPFLPQSYPCLVYANRKTEREYKSLVGQLLLESGCNFIVCAGVECELWHDVIDEEIVVAQEGGVLDAQKTIMTTWHPNDSMESLAFFFVHTTFNPYLEEQPGFSEAPNSAYLILNIGDSNISDLVKKIGKELKESPYR